MFSRSGKVYFIILSLTLILWKCDGKSSGLDSASTTTSSPLSHSNYVKFPNENSVKITATSSSGSVKRNANPEDLSSSGSVAAKSYDPPPEFYRGPGSLSKPPPYNSYSPSPTTGFLSKPGNYPANENRDKYTADSTISIANAFNKWQSQKGYNNFHDRISVGHYSSPDHTASSYGSSISGGGGSGPYGSYYSQPYDKGHPNEYVHSATHLPNGYFGGNSAEGVPFDVYGSKGHYSGGGGADYSYSSYPEHTIEQVSHKGYGEYSQKALLAKSFLIPLASAAVLGIAAALVSNPLLLQLGTVSGVGPAIVGKRKRRDLNESLLDKTETKGSTEKANKLRAHSIAYRHYHDEDNSQHAPP